MKKKNDKSKREQAGEVSEKLRAWRKRRKLSQSGAAVKLRMSRRTLQEWEQGRAVPRGLALVAILDRVR
jgi:DNA-binding transcriptional regulator YiaG